MTPDQQPTRCPICLATPAPGHDYCQRCLSYDPEAAQYTAWDEHNAAHAEWWAGRTEE